MVESFNELNNREPLLSYRAMFDAELDQAVAELQRPAAALLASGVIAGMAVGVSVLLIGLIVSSNGAIPADPFARLLFGSAYAVGFILAILARTDLFTEYTTIAILPILTGDGSVAQLARLWGLVFAGNLIGGIVIAGVIVTLAPALGIADPQAFGHLAEHLISHDWQVIMLSAILAGWLMGLLSWLIAGGRDTTSQIIFIWLIGTSIGALGLHHSVTGGVELFTGAMIDPRIGWSAVLGTLAIATTGNAIGGLIFAVLVKQGVRMDPGQKHGRTDREEGREQLRRGE
jgi:formate-nitrite transporter family protein